MEIALTFVGIILAFIAAWFIQQNKTKNIISKDRATFNQELNQLNSLINEKERDISILTERNTQFEQHIEKRESELINSYNKIEFLQKENGSLKSESEQLILRLNEQKEELQKAKDTLKEEFKNISNELIVSNRQEFVNQSNSQLKEILEPFKENIISFQDKIHHSHIKSVEDQSKLRAEIASLQRLNQQISEEAHNLTKALKSDTKMQGNWGEMILERILEGSGLTKGEEYITQASYKDDEGRVQRPDVIINLPEGKHVIIDSKVSLIDYEKASSANTEEERNKYLKRHLTAIQTHVKTLSDKAYQKLPDLKSPEFVLMFLPLESAFSAAIKEEVDLFRFAWERKIVIVSPTTLLATLTTIESIWRTEKQTKNALEIAEAGGKLYDKFVGFMETFEKLGFQLQTLSNTYDDAFKKIKSGKGSLISRTEKLKELGAKNAKLIPSKYLEE
ncbi:MAG: DNA recombination protein RmuC [Hyphomicrobiales bacterium]